MTNIIPLAELLRPNHWDDVLGQDHILGPGKSLRLVFESGIARSMIFWGPPGTGKTTLARLCATAFDCEWIALSAVFAGVKDIRAAIEQALAWSKKKRRTLLFIDEIHRFNKAQQDALLPHTESGLITLIGATTENPSFEVIAPLLSRLQLYVLQPLDDISLRKLFQRAQKKYFAKLEFAPASIDYLVSYADSDARRLLNILDQVQTIAIKQQQDTISEEFIEHILSTPYRRFDKGGEQFYDQISALHKSVRGSDPDAAIYWLCRMLDGGVEPLYLARRIIRMAWEDIGLADLRAMQIASEAALTYERLGSPEGELALSQAVIYLALAPKSNAGYMAFKQAMAFVKKDKSREVPKHLRNAVTPLMKKLDYGRNYRYVHNEANAYATGVNYLPEGMQKPNWYTPSNRGLEAELAEKMAFLEKLNQKT